MDLIIKHIIREVSNELNIPEAKVKHAVEHVTNFTREQLTEYKNDVSWKKFGSFKRLYTTPKETNTKNIKPRKTKSDEEQ